MDIPWYKVALAAIHKGDDSITEIALRLGITRSALGHYLHGRRNPKPAMLRQIARELGMSVSEMVEADPTYARDDVEHQALDALRDLPEEKRRAALAMLVALAQQAKSEDDD